MILTLTLNPMLEHLSMVDGFQAGSAFRPGAPFSMFATGKPLNVGRALADLGEDVVNVLAVGRAAGREIDESLEAEGLARRLITIKRESRRGFSVYDERGVVTTVYGPAPRINDAEAETIIATIRSLLPARFIVIGGSTSRPDIFVRICALGVPVVLDTRGEALMSCLNSGTVFLAKPNLRECQASFQCRDPLGAASELKARGARWAVVTDQEKEAVFYLGKSIYKAKPPQIELVHSIGSGDALCAGMLHAMDRPPKEMVAFGVACGAYAATRPDIAHLEKEACEELASRVEVH